jgi:hypothetical protein
LIVGLRLGIRRRSDATMPFDVIKTRMQSLTAKQEYKNLFHCGWRIVKEEGIPTLWKGSVPRLARLSVSLPSLLALARRPASGSIVFWRCFGRKR